jgi:hypothetical protein
MPTICIFIAVRKEESNIIIAIITDIDGIKNIELPS